MPILGEVASKVAEFFTGRADTVEKPAGEASISEKELKKYQSWIKLANQKWKDDVEKPTKKFIQRLKQKFPDVTDDDLQSKFNYYKVNLDRLMPTLVPKEIKVKLKPVEGKDTIPVEGGVFDNRRAGVILNNKLNQLLQDKSFKYTIEAVVHDALLSPLGGVVVGHTANIKTNDEAPQETQELLAEKQANGEAIPGETALNTEKVVTKIGQMPKLLIKHESWRNVRVDPKATDYFFANARYKVRVVRLPLEEAKVLYGDIEATETDDDLPNELQRLDEAKMAVVYEVYDYTADGEVERLTFLGAGQKLVERTTLKYDPLALIKLNYLSGEVYPPCDMTYYEDQVDEANYYRTTRMNQVSRGAARKVIVATDTVDAENEERLNSNKDLEMVTAKLKAGQSLENVVKVIGSATISQDLYANQTSVAQDIQELSGVNATRLGQVPNAPATNATLANNAFESITARRFNLIKDFISQIVERVIIVIKEISIEQQDMLIEQEDGSSEIIKWSNEDIKYAELVVEMDLQADEPTDQKVKRILDWNNWVMQPQITQALMAEGKKIEVSEVVKEVSSYVMPNSLYDKFIVDAGSIVDPDHENLLMLAGQFVQPLQQEDFKKHIDSHKLFLQHPALQGQEGIAQTVQQHITDTEAMMNEQEQLKQVNVAPTQKEGPLAAQARGAGV